MSTEWKVRYPMIADNQPTRRPDEDTEKLAELSLALEAGVEFTKAERDYIENALERTDKGFVLSVAQSRVIHSIPITKPL